MRRVLVLIAVAALIGASLAIPAFADTTGTVTATVTVSLVSVSVAPTAMAYGVQALGATNLEPGTRNCGGSANPAFTASNNGSVTEDLTIRGTDSVSTNWTLGAVAAAETYVHLFRLDPPCCTFNALTLASQALISSLVSADALDVYMNLDMPTASASTTEESFDVIVLATASP